jgi:hypothetical protein
MELSKLFKLLIVARFNFKIIKKIFEKTFLLFSFDNYVVELCFPESNSAFST